MLYTTNGKRCCVVRYNCAFNFQKNKNSLEPNGIERGRRRQRTKTNGRERAREQTNKFVRSIVLVLHFQSDTVDFAFGIKKLFLLFIICFGFSYFCPGPANSLHLSAGPNCTNSVHFPPMSRFIQFKCSGNILN